MIISICIVKCVVAVYRVIFRISFVEFRLHITISAAGPYNVTGETVTRLIRPPLKTTYERNILKIFQLWQLQTLPKGTMKSYSLVRVGQIFFENVGPILFQNSSVLFKLLESRSSSESSEFLCLQKNTHRQVKAVLCTGRGSD